MSVVKIKVEAQAPTDQLDPQYRMFKKGVSYINWGELSVMWLLTDGGSWSFFPRHPIDYVDDFWRWERPPGARFDHLSKTYETVYAGGQWVNQLNMNLLLYSERPRSRLAMTLNGFTPRGIGVGSQGIGTLVRGNTDIHVSSNPVIPQGGSFQEQTDGYFSPLRWSVTSIYIQTTSGSADRLGYKDRLGSM